MSRNVSTSSIGERYQRQLAEKLQSQISRATDQKPSKYRNKKTVYKSIQGFERRYDSKKEAAYAADLDKLIRAKDVLWWLPQVSIPLPGGVVYRADFLVHRNRGVEFVDVKGRDTQASINKRKQVKALFGIYVRIV